MFNILLYGDSNTFGHNCEHGERYDITTRWAGRLGAELGSDYHITEAGTSGMTIAFDDPEMAGVYMNGTKCLPTYILSQRPLDLISIMLGTNDTKHHFSSNTSAIAENLRGMIRLIKNHPDCAATKILVVSPVPLIIQDPPIYDMDKNSGVISRELGSAYEKVCREEGVYFADSAAWGIELQPDGVHISKKGGYKFAKHMSAVIKNIFTDEIGD